MQTTTKSSLFLTFVLFLFSGNINAKTGLNNVEHRISTVKTVTNIENFAGKWVLNQILDKDKKPTTALPLNKVELELMLSGKCKISYGTNQGSTDFADIAWSTKDVFGVENAWINKDILGDAKLSGFTAPFPFSQFTGPVLTPASVNGASVFDHLEWIVVFKGEQYTVQLKKAA
ncbi:hypothetical protein NF867_02010 [Solitalea sp. MAHUQ-68]|uniref:Lipocalin-like domain-containing protein n=1 Tax=Solitalea agri TaxID=2953739 RepID=A0A9X2JBN3_9SPHI|nr:hypothetical protein [Solitalea agri]MCO4291639.1 hypothetical protein [Solitalea agri]